jgi:Asp-tRNA(Asn)/Glu-tRNA(Gln) amidotransferase A subunit family amidase
MGIGSYASASEIRAAIVGGEVSAAEVMAETLSRMEAVEPALNAFVTLTGNPAASIPCGFTDEGLPVGLQMVTAIKRETDLLGAAAAFEEAHPWAHVVPSLELEPEGEGSSIRRH